MAIAAVVLSVPMETLLVVAITAVVLSVPTGMLPLAVALATMVLPVQALTGITLALAHAHDGYGTASGHRCAITSPGPHEHGPVQRLASLEQDSCSVQPHGRVASAGCERHVLPQINSRTSRGNLNGTPPTVQHALGKGSESVAPSSCRHGLALAAPCISQDGPHAQVRVRSRAVVCTRWGYHQACHGLHQQQNRLLLHTMDAKRVSLGQACTVVLLELRVVPLSVPLAVLHRALEHYAASLRCARTWAVISLVGTDRHEEATLWILCSRKEPLRRLDNAFLG